MMPLGDFPRRGPFGIGWIPPDGGPYRGPGGYGMKLVAGSLPFAVVVSLIVGGPLATFARAQQPAEPAQPPEPSRGVVKMIGGLSEAALYTAGAGVANVVHIPGKAVLCGLGVVVGGGLLILTLGAAYKGAAAFGQGGGGGQGVLTPGDRRGTDFLLGTAERSERD